MAESRNQLQGVNWIIHKYTEAKQHAIEQPMGKNKQNKPWEK